MSHNCANLLLLVLGQATAMPHREFFELGLSGQDCYEGAKSFLLPVEPFVFDHLELTSRVVFLFAATEVDLLQRTETRVGKIV